jgi:hypothetical protein
MSTKNIILIAVAALAFWYLFIYKEKETMLMGKPDSGNGGTPSTPPSGPGSTIPQQSLVNVPNPTVRIAPIGG